MKRLPLLLSFVALIALSASLAYWGLQLYQPQQRPLAAAAPPAMPEPPIDAAASLFGGQAAALATNYQLTGVIAAGRDSAAILVAEGKPPQALKVGRELAPGVRITAVHPRYVVLSEGGVLKRIEMATDAKAGLGMGGPGGAPMPDAGQPQGPPPRTNVIAAPPPDMPPPMTTPPVGMPPVGMPPAGTPAAETPVGEPPPIVTAPVGAPPPAPPIQMPPPTRAVGTQPPSE